MDILTAPTLLEKLKRSDDHQAWDRFYKIYSPIIFGIARKFGFERSGAEDILQETMCNLVSTMPKFEYQRRNGRFSSYLYTIVRSIVSKRVKKRKIDTLSLNELAACDGHYEIPDTENFQFFDELERRRKDTIKRIALDRVKNRVEPLTWRSFSAFVMDGKSSAGEVASLLGIKDRNAIYQHKNRVLLLLREEIKNLEQEIGDFNELESWNESDFEDATLKTLKFAIESPGANVETRVKIIRKALATETKIPIDKDKLLVITKGNNWWEPLSDKFDIGSDEGNHLQLNSNYLSKKHCTIIFSNSSWSLEDLKSTNGTLVNGSKIKNYVLNDGDIIQLGDVMLLFVSTHCILADNEN